MFWGDIVLNFAVVIRKSIEELSIVTQKSNDWYRSKKTIINVTLVLRGNAFQNKFKAASPG